MWGQLSALSNLGEALKAGAELANSALKDNGLDLVSKGGCLHY
jgi:hypothetical protein